MTPDPAERFARVRDVLARETQRLRDLVAVTDENGNPTQESDPR
jgi:hypothetical protein